MKKSIVNKGDVVTVEIVDIGVDGDGIAKYQGFTLFISDAVPGDIVKAKITEVKRSYGRGVLVAVLQPSPDRVAQECLIYDTCGGCQLQSLKYDAQLRFKQKAVADAIQRIGRLEDVKVHPIVPAASPYSYRNRAQFPVGVCGKDIIMGFFRKGSHIISDVSECNIQHPLINETFSVVKSLLRDYGVSAYDEVSHTGLLRHVVIRVAVHTQEVMVIFVTSEHEFPDIEMLSEKLVRLVPNVKSVIQNVNPKKTNVILGRENQLILGRDFILERIAHLQFKISPLSFVQVNPEQTEVLYNVVKNYVGLSGQETVIDAFCGIGTISLFLAGLAKHVYGIEIVPDAIKDATENAKLNNITNAHFICGDVEEVLPQLSAKGVTPDIIVLDPPRSGCSESSLKTIASMVPASIVYVSCNPSTLARDMAVLSQLGYETSEVQPVDMFPQTSHVECVVLMSRVEK
jgi:23S rRNA (uracil1939-C5)-methyltransferase